MVLSAELLLDEEGLTALVVDVEGALVRSSLPVESAVAFAGANPCIPDLICMLARGKAH